MLGHQPALGTPWISLGGVIVYAPWKLFAWWIAFDAQAPEVFRRAGLLALAGGIAPALIAIGGAAWRSRAETTKTTYGSSRWANMRECAAPASGAAGVFLGLFGEPICAMTAPSTSWPLRRRARARAWAWSCRRCSTWTGSAVIHDIKGENWQLTAGWRVAFLALPAVQSDRSALGPLQPAARSAQRRSDEVRDVQNIADILVDPEGALERRNHWEKTSHALLVGAILHVLYAEEEKTLAPRRHLPLRSRALLRAHAARG